MSKELKKGSRVSAVIDDEVYNGTITETKGKEAVVKFDDDDVQTIRIADLTAIVEEGQSQADLDKQAEELAAEQKANDEAEAEKKAQEEEAAKKAEEDAKAGKVTIENVITVPQSKVSISSNIAIDPIKLKVEEAKQKKQAEKRNKNRIAKITAKPLSKMKVRENLLKARLGKVKKGIPHTYRKEQIIVWAEELRMIQNSPEQWSQGCVKSKKKKSAQDYIDGLNID